MKRIGRFVSVLLLLYSCSDEKTKNSLSATSIEPFSKNDSLSVLTTANNEKELNSEKHYQKITAFSDFERDKNEIPPSGNYLFDIAFAEWQGKSMGVKVAVIIKGDSAKVIYEGIGSLSAEIGTVIDEGLVMKHKSGEWIIGKSSDDKSLDEVGGCTGGPSVIDFKNKKYWIC